MGFIVIIDLIEGRNFGVWYYGWDVFYLFYIYEVVILLFFLKF